MVLQEWKSTNLDNINQSQNIIIISYRFNTYILTLRFIDKLQIEDTYLVLQRNGLS